MPWAPAASTSAHVRQLEQAGCRIVRFNSPRWYSLEEVNYRTHRKILVVDGEVAFTGGAGIGDHWMGDAQDPDHWRDTMVQIVGPGGAARRRRLLRELHRSGGEVAPELDNPDCPWRAVETDRGQAGPTGRT